MLTDRTVRHCEVLGPGEVYSLSEFPEEVKGIAAAKCSRSPNTFYQDAEMLTVEKAADLHEKIVVGYGHNSVADMSMGSLCFEQISTLAAEDLFDIQTGKFQAKSSRYVPFSRERVIHALGPMAYGYQSYWRCIDILFDAYEGLHEPVRAWVEQQENMQGKPASVINARVFDNLRYLLPLGCLTNVGTRLSSRDTAELVRRWLSSPLAECKNLAGKVVVAARAETPTLLRHAEHRPIYDALRNIKPAGLRPELDWYPNKTFVQMAVSGQNRRADVADALAREYGYRHFNANRNPVEYEKVLGQWMCAMNEYLAQRKTRHDPLPHAMRAAKYSFEVQSDFGAWKDLRRHRRCELFREETFTARLGYTIPEDIKAIGGKVLAEYTLAMERATEQWADVNERWPFEAQYLVTHGHIQRWQIDLDLEQLYYMVELRTEPFGHISYRRIAYEMYAQAAQANPELFKHILVHKVEGTEAHH